MKSPLLARERILVMGTFNSGKSTCWSKWAEYLSRAGNTAYVCDTDCAAQRMLGGEYEGTESINGREWDSYGNIKVLDTETWDDFIHFADTVKKLPGRDDLVVIDMIDKAWSAVQEDYSDLAFGKPIDELMLEAKIRSIQTVQRGGKDPGSNAFADSHGQNWGVINGRYRRFMTGAVYRTKAHVLACTPADTVSKDDASDEQKRLYGKWGLKPRGQKDLGHAFHTILLVSEDKDGHRLSTVKERDIKAPEPARELFKGEVFEDFVLDYLVLNAGWKLK